MLDLLIEFKPVIMQFMDIILLLFGSAFVTLGLVYVFGRMLNIMKSDKTKNIFAIFIIYGIHYAYTYFNINNKVYSTQYQRGWEVFLFGSISIVIYVTVCWRLYSRIDSYLDKKLGDDSFKPFISKKSIKRKFKKKTK